MTERKWRVSTDLGRMMRFVQGRIGERRLVLFGCACWYRQWRLIPDDCCKLAVETAERFADGRCDAAELRAARERVLERYPNLFWYQDCGCHAEAASYFAAFDAAAAREMEVEHPLNRPGNYLAFVKMSEVAGNIAAAVTPHNSPGAEAVWRCETAAQCDILRDILGNPFRPARVDPAWLARDGGAIPKLARALYEERHFADMPILADAMEEAGCTDGEILGHCRRAEPHVRGCWALDLLLGRE